MTTQQKTSRATTVRQRRTATQPSKPAGTRTSQTARKVYHPASAFLPVEPRPAAPKNPRNGKSNSLRQAFGVSSPATSRASHSHRMTNTRQTGSRNSNRKEFDFVLSLGRTAVRAPVFSLPNWGSRWVSVGLTLLLGFLLYTMGTANTFKVGPAEVTGNKRLSAAEISSMARLIGQPIYKVIPSQMESNLRTAFPDLAGVSVKIGFPNHIRVTVIERTPVLAWYRDGVPTWIDPNGIAFAPRGDLPGLVQISSTGNPPKLAEDPLKTTNEQSFIAPDMVQAILTLHPQVPGEAPMIYDPKYGIGWQDARGWSVYFGNNSKAIDMKKNVYQAILESFSQKGIQPTLISVAYLGAPFYK
jgi:hypothetical protein